MAEKTDRRVRKTKAALRAGLAKLMQEKSMKEITIKELVDEVDINRSTFYLHYTDIFHMLDEIEVELSNEITRAIDTHPIGPTENIYSLFVDIFSILSSNRDICSALLGPNGDISFINKIEDIIVQHSLTSIKAMFPFSNEDIIFALSFCLSGCVGLIKAWLAEAKEETPEHMAKLTYTIITNTLRAFYEES